MTVDWLSSEGAPVELDLLIALIMDAGRALVEEEAAVAAPPVKSCVA